MQTPVLNNLERIVIGQFRSVGKDTAGRPLMGGTITLRPGINLVPSDTLKKLCEESPNFAKHFETKIEAMKAPEGPQPDRIGRPVLEIFGKDLDDKAPLAKLPPPDAIKLIKETLDASVLKRWKKDESRDSVIRACTDQLDMLSGKNVEE